MIDPSLPLLEADGTPFRIEETWRSGPALLLFVRHFACGGCSLAVHELADRVHEISDLGISSWVITTSPPELIAGFVESHGLGKKSIRVVADPGLGSFRAAGLQRGLWGVIGPRALYDYADTFRRGHLNGIPSGDMFQLGGTLLVEGGTVVHRRINTSLADVSMGVDLVGAALALAARKRA